MAAYNLIATTTVGSGGAASIVFSGIPQTFTDLMMVVSGRASRSAVADDMFINFNGSTSNITNKFVYGNGASVASTSYSLHAGNLVCDTATANTFANTNIYIPNYTSANYKSFSVDSVTENNSTTAYTDLVAGLWSVTDAVTSLTIYSGTSGSNFMQYSSASLYGIKNS